jgi:lysine/ornithine N-monooxygenase
VKRESIASTVCAPYQVEQRESMDTTQATEAAVIAGRILGNLYRIIYSNRLIFTRPTPSAFSCSESTAIVRKRDRSRLSILLSSIRQCNSIYS